MPFLDYTGLGNFWSKVKEILAGKQNSLVAGEGVSLENDVVSIQEPVKEVTKVQYDALTEEQKNTGLYVVTDAMINLNDHGDIYSTEETRIGKWIDGKPLYRKVINAVTLETLDTWQQLVLLPSEFEVVYLYACLIGKIGTGDRFRPLPNNMVEISVQESNALSVWLLNSLASNVSVWFTIEYTKTTDSTQTAAAQNLPVNSFTSSSKVPEKVILTSQVPLPSYVQFAPASASSASFQFAPASASSASFQFAPASASSASFQFAPASASSTNFNL